MRRFTSYEPSQTRLLSPMRLQVDLSPRTQTIWDTPAQKPWNSKIHPLSYTAPIPEWDEGDIEGGPLEARIPDAGFLDPYDTVESSRLCWMKRARARDPWPRDAEDS